LLGLQVLWEWKEFRNHSFSSSCNCWVNSRLKIWMKPALTLANLDFLLTAFSNRCCNYWKLGLLDIWTHKIYNLDTCSYFRKSLVETESRSLKGITKTLLLHSKKFDWDTTTLIGSFHDDMHLGTPSSFNGHSKDPIKTLPSTLHQILLRSNSLVW